MNTSHWIIEHDILSRQLQQHRIVEEFVNADVLAQTLKKINEENNTISRGTLAAFHVGSLSLSNWNLWVLVFVEGGTPESLESMTLMADSKRQRQLLIFSSFLLIRKKRPQKCNNVCYYSLQIQIISLCCIHSWRETTKVSFLPFAVNMMLNLSIIGPGTPLGE